MFRLRATMALYPVPQVHTITPVESEVDITPLDLYNHTRVHPAIVVYRTTDRAWLLLDVSCFKITEQVKNNPKWKKQYKNHIVTFKPKMTFPTMDAAVAAMRIIYGEAN